MQHAPDCLDGYFFQHDIEAYVATIDPSQWSIIDEKHFHLFAIFINLFDDGSVPILVLIAPVRNQKFLNLLIFNTEILTLQYKDPLADTEGLLSWVW